LQLFSDLSLFSIKNNVLDEQKTSIPVVGRRLLTALARNFAHK
jgi:hypothetical protein